MKVCQAYSFLSAAVLAIVVSPLAPTAAADSGSCPDVQLVFARGTTEAPGLGYVGDRLVDSLRTRISPKSLGTYAVDYPATPDFPTALQGIDDAGKHIEAVAANCPSTKMVLGGYSQGAAVMGFVTSQKVPDGAPTDVPMPQPMPASVADHVAAVTLFGTPSVRFMGMISQPPVAIGPLYADKTAEFCVQNDPVCSSDGGDWSAHSHYIDDGMVDQAADFAARLINAAPASPPTRTPAPSAGPTPTPTSTAKPLPSAPPLSSSAPAPAPAPSDAASPAPAPGDAASPAPAPGDSDSNQQPGATGDQPDN